MILGPKLWINFGTFVGMRQLKNARPNVVSRKETVTGWNHLLTRALVSTDFNIANNLQSQNILEFLSKLLGKYDDLQRNLYIYIGDLHRYSVIMCHSDHLEASRSCYEKAFSEGNPNEYNGRSLNQIALLYQYQKGSEMLWQSVRLLLRAMIAPVPYERAWDNLKIVDGSGFEGHRKIAFDLIKSSLDDFRFDFCQSDCDPCKNAQRKMYRRLIQ